MSTTKTIDQLRNEIRYSERLCQRTARLYRRVQTAGTFLAILGSSGTLSALSPNVYSWVPIAGAFMLTAAGAALVAIRPGDKASTNEIEMKRYSALHTKSQAMTAEQLAVELDAARQSDTPEIEPLRNVAYNDVVREAGRDDCIVQLSKPEKFLAALA